MLKKIFLTTLCILLLSAISVLASPQANGGWSDSISLGEGYSPELSFENDKLKLTFARDGKLFQSFYQKNERWSKSEATGDPEATELTAGEKLASYDTNGNMAWVTNTEEGVSYTQDGSEPVKILFHKGDYSSYAIYFYIDENDVKHVIYSYGKDKEAPDLYYKRQEKGKEWSKSELVAKKISYFRDWQKPGVAITPSGNIYICTYNDLFSKIDNGPWQKENCKFDNIYMPVKIIADNNENLHFLYYSWQTDRDEASNGLYYTVLKSGKWRKSIKIGDQKAETIPCVMLTEANELFAAWTDTDLNIIVAKKILN